MYAVPSTTDRHHFQHNTFWDNYDGDYVGDDDPIGTFDNTAEDPLFVAYSVDANLGNDDLTLQTDSPCVDTGPPGMSDPAGGLSDRGSGGADYDVTLTGGTHYVSQYAPSTYDTVSAAIADAGSGDVIVLYPGLYYETADFDGKNLTVISVSGPEVTTILGNSMAVRIDSGENPDAVLDGFTISSYGSYGLYVNAASPTVQYCTVADVSGYATYVSGGGSVTFLENVYEDNSYTY